MGGECDHETEKFLDWLNKFGEKHNIKFTITISDDAALGVRPSRQRGLLGGAPPQGRLGQVDLRRRMVIRHLHGVGEVVRTGLPSQVVGLPILGPE